MIPSGDGLFLGLLSSLSVVCTFTQKTSKKHNQRLINLAVNYCNILPYRNNVLSAFIEEHIIESCAEDR